MAEIALMGFGATGPIFTDCTITGDTFNNASPGTVLLFRNKNANPRTITITSPNPCEFGITHSAHDRVVTIAGDGGLESYLRLTVNPSRHNDGAGNVSLTYSAVAGLSCAALLYGG
jgi:hypothetical protein